MHFIGRDPKNNYFTVGYETQQGFARKNVILNDCFLIYGPFFSN